MKLSPFLRFAFLLSTGLVFACPADAKTLNIYIITGQSNSLGAVKSEPASDALLSQYQSSSTQFWHENFTTSDVVYDQYKSTSWGSVAPQGPYYSLNGSASNPCMGPEYGFAWMMEKKQWNCDANTDLAIIKASRDGGGNTNWDKDSSGKAYQNVLNAVKNAYAQIQTGEYDSIEFSGLMYLQGESNSAAEANVAADRFSKLVSNLKADLAAEGYDTSNFNSILGEISAWSGNQSRTTTKDQQENLAASDDSMGWVPTGDLAKISDNLHFSGKSQITIGARYAYEAAKLAGYDVGTVRSGNYDAVLSSTDAWMNGRLPSDTVAVWDVASSAKDNMIAASAGTNAALYGISIEDSYLDTITIKGVAAGSNPSLNDAHLILKEGGINISQGKNLTLATGLELAGDQTWNIAGGSALSIKGCGTSGNQTLTYLTGSGDLNIVNSTLASNPDSIAKVNFEIHINSTIAGFTGNWTIGPGVEIQMNGSQSKGSGTAATGWGTGSVTLQGATVLAGWENFPSEWSNRFILQEGTSSRIGGASDTAGKTLTMSGMISGKGALEKIAANTLLLTGKNTYEGGTSIKKGSIRINNSEALGSGIVTVETGGELNLNGISIANTIHLNGGNITNWGSSARLQLSQDMIWSGNQSLALSDGSRLDRGYRMTIEAGFSLTLNHFIIELGSDNLLGSGRGLAAISLNGGNLTLNGGLVLDIGPGSRATPTETYTFNLFDYSSGAITGLDSLDDLILSENSIQNWQLESFDSLTGNVVIRAIPEASSAALLLMGFAGLAFRRRRRQAPAL